MTIKQKIANVFSKPSNVAIGLFVVAAFLRLCLLSTSYYSAVGELYRDMEVIWNLFHYHQWPLLGPSSALGGFYFGAAYYYIEGLFVFLFRYIPYGAVFSSTFFSLLSLPLLYALCRKWFTSPWVAPLAVGLQSVALFDIQNSYYVSNPNFLPSFLLALCLLLTLIVEKPKTWHYAVLGVVLGIGTQLHATALIMMPLILVVVFIRHKVRPTALQILLVFGLWSACFTPYVIYEFTHHFALLHSLFAIGHKQATGGSRIGIILGFLNFFGSFLVFKDGSFNYYPGHPAAFFAAIFMAAVLVASVLWISFKDRFRPSASMLHPAAKTALLAWFFGGFAMYLIFPVPPAYYYFIIMWPLPVLLAAWWLGSLRTFSKKYFVMLLVGYAVLQLFNVSVFLSDIYHPEYSYGDIQRALGFVKASGAGRDYLVMNQSLDVNQFLYYLRLDGLNMRSRPSAEHYSYFDLIDCPAPGTVLQRKIFRAGSLCVQVEQK